MRRGYLLILIIAPILAGLLYGVGGFLQYRAYRKIASNPGFAMTLTMSPTPLRLQPSDEGELISLGFADLRLPPNTVRSIQCPQGWTDIRIHGKDEVYRLTLGPMTVEEKARSQANWKEITASYPQIEYPFDKSTMSDFSSLEFLKKSRQALLTMPLTEREVFWMTSSAFKNYSERALLKLLLAGDQFSLYQVAGGCSHVRIIRQDGKSTGFATLWPTDGAYWLNFDVQSDSLDDTHRKLEEFLSSFRFVLSVLPMDMKSRRSLITSALKGDPRFSEPDEKERPLPEIDEPEENR